MYKCIPALQNIFVLNMFILFMFSVMAGTLLQGKLWYCTDWSVSGVDECFGQDSGGNDRQWLLYPEHFEDTFNSMLTMFEISYMENWVDVLWMVRQRASGLRSTLLRCFAPPFLPPSLPPSLTRANLPHPTAITRTNSFLPYLPLGSQHQHWRWNGARAARLAADSRHREQGHGPDRGAQHGAVPWAICWRLHSFLYPVDLHWCVKRT